ncbi:VOC family protein [Saccharopolyspora sp. HNM0983]|uniref:VOC family protein n=1 Tax=Saccharopolyspora montiporae TaxID=2781240 RepID=A0A929B500_9PSEU|nr:VOC family protein [Saccharopolyspora sp. HNM0983]MBE9373292.1 VOC family protein [Saccharopolyspora sp. HNM0983]
MTQPEYDPGPQIAHAASIDLGTPDLERSIRFFRDLLGMEVVDQVGGVAYLRAYQEFAHHSLVLTQQDEARVNSYGFRVKRKQDVELFHKRFQEQGVQAVELPAGHELGRGEAVRFLVPGSDHPFEFFHDIDKPLAEESIRSKVLSNSSRRRGLGVRRLDHINLQTSAGTVNEAEAWLQDSLGFKRREFARLPDAPDIILASWLSVTPQVHDVAIGVAAEEKTGQFHHVAFNVENFHDILTAADEIRDLDIAYGAGPGKHGIGQAMYLYVHDPGSGHRIELYSGGYLIFDPTWEALEWKLPELAYGQTWYGDVLDVGPGGSFLPTSPSAGLLP